MHACAAALRQADVAHVLEGLLGVAQEGGRGVDICGCDLHTEVEQRAPQGRQPGAAPAGWPAASGWPR